MTKNTPNIESNNIKMAVDRSLQEGKSSASVVIKDDDDNITRVSIPVNGSIKDTTSYRAELAEIYRRYLHLETTGTHHYVC